MEAPYNAIHVGAAAPTLPEAVSSVNKKLLNLEIKLFVQLSDKIEIMGVSFLHNSTLFVVFYSSDGSLSYLKAVSMNQAKGNHFL